METAGAAAQLNERQQALHAVVVAAADDLPGQLRALLELGKTRGSDPANVEAVRRVVFTTHGWA